MQNTKKARIDAERILDPMDKTVTLDPVSMQNLAREYLRISRWADRVEKESEDEIP